MHRPMFLKPFWVLGVIGFCSLAYRPLTAQVIGSSEFRQYKALNPSIERAFKALKAHRFEESKAILKPCLEAIPNHFEAHYILALMDYEARDYPSVLAHLDISERTLAALDRSYRSHVAELKARGDANEQTAKDNLAAASSHTSDPTGFSAPKLASLGMEVKIAEAENKPVEGLQNPYAVPGDYLYLRGNALLRLGRRDEARDLYRKTVAADAGHANAWNNLIALGLGARDLEVARKDLTQAEKVGITIRPELKRAVLEAH